ncbi:hypothetical protein [Brachybacterium aquaticum]|uniref:NADPH:quinone reductase-like Zn-dependent oxidoreductase n=1 Tax=Brachybacterium aquaticum TaxID=1432564 RepID=A0A841AAU2_9MICO|nr:hypothetical protein [Brachybacterium aquaticum]MBB5830751.1 NADPH:quinone reductase-like Zn-dependent oxidoreductase [Brachybacterium aquaticum]
MDRRTAARTVGRRASGLPTRRPREGPAHLSCGTSAFSPASTIDLDALSYRHLTAHGVSFGFSRHFESAPILEDLRPVLLPAAGRGEIRPVIDRTVGIEQFGEVTEVLRSGDAVGKLVMTFA